MSLSFLLNKFLMKLMDHHFLQIFGFCHKHFAFSPTQYFQLPLWANIKFTKLDTHKNDIFQLPL